MSIRLIVGLGNPGSKYATTRHNVGFWYINLLAVRYCKILKKKEIFYGHTSKFTIGKHNVYLLIPTTFMNLSGKSIAAMASFYHLNPEEIVVVHDELYLDPGDIQFKIGGSHYGHNGLKNTINYLGNNTNFCRLRIGIGRPDDKHEIINFVLSTPSIAEQQLINMAIEKGINYIENLIIKNNVNKFNNLNIGYLNI